MRMWMRLAVNVRLRPESGVAGASGAAWWPFARANARSYGKSVVPLQPQHEQLVEGYGSKGRFAILYGT